MKRHVIVAILKMCGEVILFTLIAGIVIGVMGYLNKWNTSIAYSNAFFVAGCLAIIGGMSSRLAASREWDSFRGLYAESFRDMSPTERANFIVDASSPLRLVILGLLCGIVLILISVLVVKVF